MKIQDLKACAGRDKVRISHDHDVNNRESVSQEEWFFQIL